MRKKQYRVRRNVPKNNKPSLIGSMGQGMATGAGIGMGIEGARKAFEVIGYGSNNEESDQCQLEKKELYKCLETNNNCKELIELLNNCYKK